MKISRLGRHTGIAGLGMAFACATLLMAPDAVAQQWPEKPIRIVTGFPPGPLDVFGRPVAIKLQESLGQTVIFENRAGANGAIAAEQVSKSAPDGYTLFIGTSGTHVTAVHLTPGLRYDPVKDFKPVIAAVEPVTVMVINPKLPVNSVQEFIAYAKANPGKVSYASTGIGSVFHLVGELFKQTTGIDMVHVPYRGGDVAMNDLVAGHIPVAFTSATTAGGHIASGTARVLAVLEPERFDRMPNVPSVTEVVPAFRKPSTWMGFFAPPGTPDAIVMRLNSEIAKALNEPAFKAKLAEGGYAVIAGPPQKLHDLMVEGIDRFGKIIRDAGIKPEGK